MAMKRTLIAITLGLAFAGTALAEVPAKVKMVCPIDGKTFEHLGYAAYSTYGAGLDGRPYGSTRFPLRLPECPDSKMPVYRDYKPAEVAKLKAYAATEDFKSLANENPYFRLYMVEKQLGEPADTTLYALMSATWDAQGADYLRYGQVLVKEADTWLATQKRGSDAWWTLEFRLVNVERQMGAFSAAGQRLAILNAAGRPPKGAEDYVAETAKLIDGKDSAEYVYDAFNKGWRSLGPPHVMANGHDQLLRRLIGEAAQGRIAYETLSPALGEAVRSQAATAQSELAALGALRSVTLMSTDKSGMEMYRTVFEKGSLDWAFHVGDQGLIDNAIYKPTPP
jgi:hypothetical protein